MTLSPSAAVQKDPYRRWFGLLLGAAIGLGYGFVSQTINHLLLPGISFYQPPFGPLGNLLMAVLLGALLGLVTAWPDTGFTGVVLSSLLGSLALSVPTLLTGPSGAEAMSSRLTAVIIIFVPTAAVLAPLMTLLRWLIAREVDYRRDPLTWQRVLYPLLIVLISAALGFTFMLPPLGRAVTPRMNALVQQALQAATTQQLPEPLQSPEVPGFLQNARGPYTLQWDKDDTNRFAIPRPATSFYDQSIVVARFASGYWLVCMYPTPTAAPRCKGIP